MIKVIVETSASIITLEAPHGPDTLADLAVRFDVQVADEADFEVKRVFANNTIEAARAAGYDDGAWQAETLLSEDGIDAVRSAAGQGWGEAAHLASGFPRADHEFDLGDEELCDAYRVAYEIGGVARCNELVEEFEAQEAADEAAERGEIGGETTTRVVSQ